MTLLEMLDALEFQIVELRAKNDQLTAALQTARDGTEAVPKPANKIRKRASKPKKTRTPVVPKAKPLETAVIPEQAPKERALLGKRQALGRSLLQLRRLGAVAEQNSARGSEAPNEELITRG